MNRRNFRTGRPSLWGGPNDVLYGGPDDEASLTSENLDLDSTFESNVRSSRGVPLIGGKGVPFIMTRGLHVHSSPLPTDAMLQTDVARGIMFDGMARQPTQAISAQGNNASVVLTDPGPTNVKREFAALLLRITIPTLAGSPASLFSMEVVGTNPNGGVMNYAPIGAPNGRFELELFRTSTQSASILLIPATLINNKPEPERVCVTDSYTGFGGVLPAVSTDVTVTFPDNLPIDARTTLVGLTANHPTLRQFLAAYGVLPQEG